MNRAVSNRRLLTLADRLKTVPREQFDMGVFVGRDWKGDPNLGCGTRACAAGWATTIPSFRRQGFRLESTPSFGGRSMISPVYQGETDFAACRLFFGLDYGEADRIFGGSIECTPKQKAREIIQFVKRREREQ